MFIYGDTGPYAGKIRFIEWWPSAFVYPKFPLEAGIELHNQDPPEWRKKVAMHELGHAILVSGKHSPYVNDLMFAGSRVKSFSDKEIRAIKELYLRPNQTKILIFNNDYLLTKKVYEK